jgi:ribosomal protein S18 acetylase RimI-like enzyme
MAADRARVEEILSSTRLFTADEIEAAIRQVDESLEMPERGEYIVHVAESAGQLLGYVTYGPAAGRNVFDIYWIAVDPDYQQQGIGTQLLRFVENEVRRQNGVTLLIETSSSDAYSATRAFYQRRGYEEISRIKDFYRLEHDKVIFCRTLS